MQKLTDLKGFQRSCFKLLWGWFFFKIVLFYFEVATFSSIALRAFACALRLSPHVASRPQRGLQEAGCSAQRRVGRVPREARGAERGSRRWLQVGRRLSTSRAVSIPQPRRRRVLQPLGGGHLCTSGNTPASAFPRWQAQYYSLHTVYSPGHQPPHTGSSPQLCSGLAGGVGVCFFKLGEEPNSYCPWVPGKPVPWFPGRNLPSSLVAPSSLRVLGTWERMWMAEGEARGDERSRDGSVEVRGCQGRSLW